MSYASQTTSSEICKHNEYWRNCIACIKEKQEKRGKRDSDGILHADNGAGYCVGHIEKDPRWPDGDGLCTVLVRHCPVLNTPEQLAQNQAEDRAAALEAAQIKVINARTALQRAQRELYELRKQ